MQNVILRIWRGSVKRLYTFSQRVPLDDTWRAVQKYAFDVIGVDRKIEDYHNTALNHIIQTPHKVIDCKKKIKQLQLFGVLIVADDFADDPSLIRYSSSLHGTQTFNVLAPIIRLNSSALSYSDSSKPIFLCSPCRRSKEPCMTSISKQ